LIIGSVSSFGEGRGSLCVAAVAAFKFSLAAIGANSFTNVDLTIDIEALILLLSAALVVAYLKSSGVGSFRLGSNDIWNGNIVGYAKSNSNVI
jgi:hypothetical protein